jgi:hypothetical protein
MHLQGLLESKCRECEACDVPSYTTSGPRQIQTAKRTRGGADDRTGHKSARYPVYE